MHESDRDVVIASADAALQSSDGRLVDLVDSLLSEGVCLRGELWLSVADVDLVFAGIDVVLCSHDKIRARGERP